MGAFCCHGNQSFDPICLKTLGSLSPPPVMLHIKFDQDWPTGFRDIQVRKCKMFVIQGQLTFDDDSVKNERASMETPFSHCKSMEIFRRSRAANSVVRCRIWPKFDLVRDIMHVLVTCKYKKDRIKSNQEMWRHHFPHYKSIGAFCCHGHQSFYPICLETLCSFSPSPVVL